MRTSVASVSDHDKARDHAHRSRLEHCVFKQLQHFGSLPFKQLRESASGTSSTPRELQGVMLRTILGPR
eukprot:12879923-Alexandrium_andersonii.AAC.1